MILCGNQLTHRGYITDSNREEWLEYMRIFSSYIKLQPEIYDVIVNERDRVQKSGKQILGVLCRGTDYTKLKPLYHYIPYSAEQTVEIIDEMLVDYQQIYLATEDQQIFEVFKHRYAYMLDYTKQDRFCSEEVDCYLSEFTKKDVLTLEIKV